MTTCAKIQVTDKVEGRVKCFTDKLVNTTITKHLIKTPQNVPASRILINIKLTNMQGLKTKHSLATPISQNKVRNFRYLNKALPKVYLSF